MRRLAAVLLLACALPARANPFYVSTEATNGYAVGNDANAGTSKALPKLSLCCAAGSAIATATAGDTIFVNGANVEASTNSSNAVVSKALTILPEPGTRVRLFDSSATSVISVTHDTTATTTLGAFDIDAASTNAHSVERTNPTCASNAPTLILQGTTLRGGTSGLLLDSARCGTTTITGITGTATASNGLLWSASLGDVAAKTISVTDSQINITGTANGSNYGMDIRRFAAGASQAVNVTLTGNTVNVTAPAALGSSANARAVQLTGIASPVITGNTVSVTAASTTNDSYGIAALATSLNARGDSPRIEGNTVRFDAPAGYGIAAGAWSTLSYVDSPSIKQNKVTGSYYDSATPHCILIGRVTGGTVERNETRSCYVGILAAINQGAIITSNWVRGPYGPGLFAKGSGATTAPVFAHNLVSIDPSVAGGAQRAYGAIGVAAQSGTNNAAATFANNVIAGAGPAYAYVTVDTSQAASFDRNYYVPALSVTAPYSWQYQLSQYTALSAWAADAAVGTDFAADPQFTGGPNPTTAEGFRPRSGSPLIGAGVNVGIGINDYDGNQFELTPTIGAFRGPAARVDRTEANTTRLQ